MPVKNLKIAHFRNIIDADLEFSKQFNVIFGENGAGKTSLLEALYYLGFNRSFRTNSISQIIRSSNKKFFLFAESFEEQGDGFSHKIGLEKDQNGNKTLRINATDVSSFAEAAKILPLQFISTDSHRLFHDGPKERRQAMDWATFHVEHTFLLAWQKLQRALKHRNALLRSEDSLAGLRKLLAPWDAEFSSNAGKVHHCRKNYLAALKPLLNQLIQKFLPQVVEGFSIEYIPGWNTDEDILNTLEKNLFRDKQIGYTQLGPQRADIQFHFEGNPLEDHFSQGQQKLTAYAFQLAQGLLVREFTQKMPIYLIDDLSSELDAHNRQLVLRALIDIEAQCFITEISPSDGLKILPENTKMFHVKQGVVSIG